MLKKREVTGSQRRRTEKTWTEKGQSQVTPPPGKGTVTHPNQQGQRYAEKGKGQSQYANVKDLEIVICATW